MFVYFYLFSRDGFHHSFKENKHTKDNTFPNTLDVEIQLYP
jgi:hypothetical protein